jgi:hypothetical protein
VSKQSCAIFRANPDTGCWEWTGNKLHDGYGILKRFDGTRVRAHRHYFELHKGPIPNGFQIDHLCRNPSCVNPAHLEAVTAAENTRRGRATKLTAAIVLEIRRRVAAGEQQTALAREFGVTKNHIWQMLHWHRSWADILEAEEVRSA